MEGSLNSVSLVDEKECAKRQNSPKTWQLVVLLLIHVNTIENWSFALW